MAVPRGYDCAPALEPQKTRGLGNHCADVVEAVQDHGRDEEFLVSRKKGDLPPHRGRQPLVYAEANDETGQGVHEYVHSEAIEHEARGVVGKVDSQVDDILDAGEGGAAQGCQERRVTPAAEEVGPLPQEEISPPRASGLPQSWGPPRRGPECPPASPR